MFSKIGFNTAVFSVARVVGTVMGLVSIGFITRGLGVGGFGEYSTVLVYLGIFQILADLGLYSLLTKEISQNPDKERELFSQFFTLRLLVVVGFLVFGIGLVFLFPYTGNVKAGIILASSAFLFMSLTQLFLSVFQKYLQIYKAAIAELVGRAVQLGFVWFFFSIGGGLFHFLSAVIVGAFVIFIIDLFFMRKLITIKLSVNLSAWKRILKTTYPIAISIVFTILYFKTDILILSFLRPQEDVGIYNAAYKVLEVLIFFPAAFVGLLMPTLSRLAKENKEKLSRLLGKLFDVMVIAALPTVVLGVMLSYSAVNFIGGSEFLAAGAVLQVLFLAIGVIFFGTLFGSSIIALDLQKKAMRAYIIGFVFNFIANIIFIPKYSYMGAAWTTFLTEILVTGYLAFIIFKISPFNASLNVFAKSAFAATAAGLVAFVFMPGLHQPLEVSSFIIVGFAGVLVYLVLGYALRLHKIVPKNLMA
jgi:O-antigen/teichoic acid export membrane protein